MFNFKKICKLMLIAALFCIFQINGVAAQNKKPLLDFSPSLPPTANLADWNEWMMKPNPALQEMLDTIDAQRKGTKEAACKQKCTQTGYECRPKNLVEKDPDYECVKTKGTKETEEKKIRNTNTNAKQSQSSVTGCSSNQGIFSGLIDTGRKVFNGLRDLIYVVAGFGIIGVAVGGFFGNLNWKWLGAIVISLVVIATTGELISAITGCENFTNAMITDTLK